MIGLKRKLGNIVTPVASDSLPSFFTDTSERPVWFAVQAAGKWKHILAQFAEITVFARAPAIYHEHHKSTAHLLHTERVLKFCTLLVRKLRKRVRKLRKPC